MLLTKKLEMLTLCVCILVILVFWFVQAHKLTDKIHNIDLNPLTTEEINEVMKLCTHCNICSLFAKNDRIKNVLERWNIKKNKNNGSITFFVCHVAEFIS